MPTVFALHRARKYLNSVGAGYRSGYYRRPEGISSDFAKAIAMGADAVAVASSALIAAACSSTAYAEAETVR